MSTPNQKWANSMPNVQSSPSRVLRRTMALARAEGILLRRNMFALSTAVGAPVLLVLVQLQNSEASNDDGAQLAQGTLVVASSIALAMVFSLYCTLVTALVSRRESLVLKRLRSGEIRDGEIIVGTAAPALIISGAQVVGASAVSAVFLHLQLPTNVLLVLVAVILGAVVFIALAAVTTTLTRTAELSQLTAVPLLVGSLMCSGLMFPVAELPRTLEHLANLLPLTSVVDLLTLGLSGGTRDGGSVDWAGSFVAAVRPLLLLSAWSILSVWGARKWFRWEPRR